MSGNAADNLGRWGAPSTVIPDAIGSHVEPNGELTDNSWHEDAGQNGYGVSPPDPEPVDHSGVEKGNTIHLSPMNLPAASGRHRIDAVEEGDDPALPLNARDVAAFIINKMIGTGIFLQPPAVLLLTRSKGEALGLWILGFAYTLVSTLIYLEFARKLPHTGGELIYLDETLPTPRLLAYTIYTFYFILTYNTASNSMNFANQILISANVKNSTYQPDSRLLRFIAIVALSFFCLVHYFSGRAGRALNQFLAFFKVTLLVIVFLAGIGRAAHHHVNDWGLPSNPNGSSSATAFLLIVWSFTGWENSTFVSGEIANHRILKRGFLGAVVIVGTLYLLVNIVFLIAIPYSDLTKEHPVTAYVPVFFGGGVKAKLAWSILIAISAGGNLQAVIYTCGRVKQVIGKSNLIPWSRVWRSTSPIPGPRAHSNGRSERPTPKGGLMLHWIFSVILISATSQMYSVTEGINFPGSLQAYASGWVGIFISIGFPFLFMKQRFYYLGQRRERWFFRPRSIPEPTVRHWNHDPENILLRSAIGKAVFTVIYFAFNAYIIIVPLIPPYVNGAGVKQEVKGWYYIVIVLAIIAVGTIYYYSVFGLTTDAEGDLEHDNRHKTLLRFARAYPVLHEEPRHDPDYGVRRWVEVENPSLRPSYLYWLFGGSKEEHYPNSALVNWWHHLMGH